MVELIGGGLSSRAVIHKGALHLLGRIGAAGHMFRILDQDRVPSPAATLRFGRRDFRPDENGEILVPFTQEPGKKTALLFDGETASIAHFQHAAERYRLEAAVHAPSEALLAGMKASFSIRPRLTVSGRLIDPTLLEDAQLVIESVDMDGHRSSQVLSDLTLELGGVFSADVRVPERTREFSLRMTGHVRSLSGGKDVALKSVAVEFPINRIPSMSTMQSLLTRGTDGYWVELRGRAGEPRAGVEVELEFRHRHFSNIVRVPLKSDDSGRIQLGRLKDIDTVRLARPANLGNVWDVSPDDLHGVARELYGTSTETLRVPYTGRYKAADRRALSLLEVRGDEVLRDAFSAVRLRNRYVEIAGLGPGNYHLTLKESGLQFDLRISEGVREHGHVVGSGRALWASDLTPLQIVSVTRDGDELVAQLGGVNPSTRLHVVATKYVDPFEPAARLALAGLKTPRSSYLSRPASTYQSGRRISDEHRYILHRRSQGAYPGNMLERPGYLLNPWATSATNDSMMGDGSGGEDFEKAGGRFGGNRNLRAGGKAQAAMRAERPPARSVDFLAFPGVVLGDLVPDGEGRVKIPTERLGPNHMLRLVATDHALTVALDATGPAVEPERRELRLVKALDPSRPMTRQRRILFAKAGETLRIRDAAGAGTQTFDSLEDVFGYFRTAGAGASELARFAFLTRWPSLRKEEKLELYSEFACHELNVFLKRRDPAFFAEVALPFLENKGHRTFLDDWLLAEDLVGYLEPWRFERLNVVEKILLLKATGGDAGRYAEDLMALVPHGTFSLDGIFGQVLLAGQLEPDRGGIDRKLVEARRAGRPGKKVRGIESSRFAGVEGLELEEEEPILEDFEVSDSNESDEDADALGFEGAEESTGRRAYAAEKLLRQEAEGFFFRDLEPTQELAETHYWRVQLPEITGALITVSPFWLDFAKSDGTFVSGQFPLATRSATEMLLAIALLDLPFEAGEHDLKASGRSLEVTAASPLLLALEDIDDAVPSADGATVLVGQDYFQPLHQTKKVNGREVPNYVTGEFLTGQAYGSRVVITNPTSSPVDLQALLQIPEGAVPLAKSHVTRGESISLRPYESRSIEAFFYFPEVGDFGGYPVHVGRAGALVAAADTVRFQATSKLSVQDTTSWDWVSQNGEVSEVLEYLQNGNPQDLNLDKIAWRMADADVFARVTATLAERNVYSAALWQYGVKHRVPAATGTFLSMTPAAVLQVAAPFRSPLLELIATERASYEHLAYEPLVNGRTYAFGGRREILNDQFREQYMRFLGQLARGPELSGDDRMQLCYYLLLQDRISEA